MPSGARLPGLTPFDLAAVPGALRGGVVAIGNFDGVHRGHQALIAAARTVAADSGLPAVVLTFEPHPRSVLRPDDPVFRLTPIAAKTRLLSAAGLDGVGVAAFDLAFAAQPAEAFVTNVLVERLRPQTVVIGSDFHFGKGRAGSPGFLAAVGAFQGFGVVTVEAVCGDGGTPFSASGIRASLEAGDMQAANRDLGYRWFVIGEVVPGDRRGRDLGYPTANIRLGADCRLRHGIYAVQLRRADGTILGGVASYGRRPTFDNGAPLLEVFAFDFSGDLYGEAVTVTFVDWIRPELKFDGVPALIAAMDRDSLTARAMLASTGPGTTLDKSLAALA